MPARFFLYGVLLFVSYCSETSLPYRREGNLFAFPDGSSETAIEWVTPSTFRFCRDWGSRKCRSSIFRAEDIEVAAKDDGDRVVFETKYLAVEVDKAGQRLRVRNREGRTLLEETAPAVKAADGVTLERLSPPGERFFGLGVRPDPAIEMRGRLVQATKPFLLSSLGYGLHHSPPGRYEFDLAHTRPDRCRIVVRGAAFLEYYFHYGPTPKEVLEEHKGVVETAPELRSWDFGILPRIRLPHGTVVLPNAREPSWEALRGTVRSLLQASMSAVLVPSMDLTAYEPAPVPLFRRAMELARVMPLVHVTNSVLIESDKIDIQEELARFRRQFTPFFVSYVPDMRGRGHPIIHPLPMQFPRDATAANLDDEFMLGDEILVAPLFSESDRRPVYLPMGSWTDLRTNQSYPGKQTVEIDAGGEGPIRLVKNGSILPVAGLTAQEVMILHYIPKLGAEFFLYEPEPPDYTQIHAGPAGDVMRLEIESKKTRTYEWVVHHLARPSKVEGEEAPYAQAGDGDSLRAESWRYDAAQSNLHIRVQVPAQGQNVVFIYF